MTTEYAYGYCGMPCALCTRYRTEGKSRCPGCSHDGYYTDVCKVHHCCRDKGLAQCGECEDFPCARLGKMGDFSDLNTNRAKERTSQAILRDGFDKWYAEYALRAALLTKALESYNNGRMKRYICEIFIQNDLQTLTQIMNEAQILAGDIKERGKGFKQVVEKVLGERNN